MNAPAHGVRALGELESRFALMHSAYAGASQCVIVLRLRRRIGASELGEAVEQLQHRFQVLRCRLVNANGSWSFDEVTSVPKLANCELISPSRENDIRKVTEAVVNEPVEAAERVWSVQACTLSDGTLLCLTFHHAALDGAGAMKVATELLRALRSERVEPFDVEPLSPAADTYMRIRQGSSKPEPGPAGLQSCSAFTYRSAVMRVALGQTESDLLRETSRTAGLHPQSLLVGLLVSGLVKATCSNAAVTITTGFVLREALVGLAAVEGLGCWARDVAVPLEVGASGTFELARKYQMTMLRALMRATGRSEAWSLAGLRAELEHEDAASPFERRLLVSNLGSLNQADSALSEDLSDFWAVRNCSDGRHVFVLVLTELAGRFSLNLTYPEPLVSRATAEALMGALTTDIVELKGLAQ